MDKKPKTRVAPRKAKQKIEDRAQSERFIQAAREIGADESGKAFDKAVSKLLKKHPTGAG